MTSENKTMRAEFDVWWGSEQRRLWGGSTGVEPYESFLFDMKPYARLEWQAARSSTPSAEAKATLMEGGR